MEESDYRKHPQHPLILSLLGAKETRHCKCSQVIETKHIQIFPDPIVVKNASLYFKLNKYFQNKKSSGLARLRQCILR